AWSTDYLKRRDASDSARLDCQLLLGHVTGLDKVQLYINFDRPLGTGELATFRTLLQRRSAGEPVAYILGKKEFYGRDFAVDASVLVPRPETEHMVDLVREWVKKRELDAPKIVDVGTGSGAIAITLALEIENAVVLGIDISAEALQLARLNAESLAASDRVKLALGDVLSPVKSEGSVDVVVSNPPYLDDALMATLSKDVGHFEPHLALYGGTDGLDIVRRLIQEAARVLRPGGLLAMEIAGTDQAGLIDALWTQSGAFDGAGTVSDYAQHQRIVHATRLPLAADES
ncbi:MAG: release factor glutamine methyltransferase, partial [Myxococcota bacterium]